MWLCEKFRRLTGQALRSLYPFMELALVSTTLITIWIRPERLSSEAGPRDFFDSRAADVGILGLGAGCVRSRRDSWESLHAHFPCHHARWRYSSTRLEMPGLRRRWRGEGNKAMEEDEDEDVVG